ncbi:response regulator [Blautia sp. 2744]|uniref:Stage 0 sporulation protein A homolog n=2 Tax=Blautia TaxID=572511 RepID=D4LQG2_9FIRM|nr:MULTISPECIES: ATP-binding protein [Blautia]MBC5738963.1 response regulator [Blautia intestinalis]CBL23020.1 Signal transduction histidine kinase [Blautia obeum A2-162]
MEQREKINTKEILRASQMGMWCVEMEEGKPPRFYADEVMDELLGIDRDITPEERFVFHRSRIHPEDMQLFQEYSDKLTEVRTEIVYRYIHPVSGEMFVRCGGARDTSVTEYVAVTGIHQDISETVRIEKEKEAERRLAELNDSLRKEKLRQDIYYKELLDIENCGVLAYTMPGHKVIHMNAEALRMYGIESVEAAQRELGPLLRQVYYPDSDVLNQLKKLRNEDDMVDYECIIGKGKANECHALAKSKVVHIPTGERAVLTTFVDVSDMVMLKNALRRAEEGSRAKSSFLFAMSHDLRTPMNAIIGYAELMEAHWGEKEAATNYLQKLKGASQFLLALIGNVLEIARIESGKETLNEAPWNLMKLEETLDILLDREISRKQLTVNRNVNIRHANVYCDALKIREIIMNLLSNAVKYTAEGGKIVLDIEEKPSVQDDFMTLQIRVSDNGIGISKEYIPHIFDAFTRERSSSESGIIGTGLGLHIVKSFVDLMNGDISVESESGKGTCFTVEISCRKVPEEELQQQMEEQPENVSLAGRRLLLAEDNGLNAEIAMTILQDAEAEVELAADGKIAVDMLKDAPVGYYDTVLMDIQMPNMNGYQATGVIRKLPDERAKIPIIAITANAFEEDRQAALAAGMDDYVAKPVEISELFRTIMKNL